MHVTPPRMTQATTKQDKPMRAYAGRLHSEGERPWNESDTTDLILEQEFEHKFASPPNLTTALGHFDLGRANSCLAIGVKAAAENVMPESLKVRLSIWGDGSMTSGSCAWLATQADDPRFRTDILRTTRGSPKEHRILFDKPFSENPIVLVWISGFQLKLSGTWDLNASAKDTTKDGFTLVLITGKDTELYQGTFSWVAFIPEDGTVAGGRLDDFSVTACHEHAYSGSKLAQFGKTFKEDPEVMAGISALNISGSGMRMAFDGVTVTPEKDGLEIGIKSWWFSTVKSASISWVAVAK